MRLVGSAAVEGSAADGAAAAGTSIAADMSKAVVKALLDGLLMDADATLGARQRDGVISIIGIGSNVSSHMPKTRPSCAMPSATSGVTVAKRPRRAISPNAKFKARRGSSASPDEPDAVGIRLGRGIASAATVAHPKEAAAHMIMQFSAVGLEVGTP